MSWTGFLSPSWAWLFLLIIPLVIVYFLKLKRPRFEIPSLVLWHSVINDQRVNSPFQRFRKHLLLWLQLAILLSLILAAMQPFLRGGRDPATTCPSWSTARPACRPSTPGADRREWNGPRNESRS